MPLNTALAMKSSGSHERLSPSTHIPNNGLMDQSERQRFKAALGLPSKMKTFAIDMFGMRDLYLEADESIRLQLRRKGLFVTKPQFQEGANFIKMGNITISLGPLYDNKEIAMELIEDKKVRTSFTLKVGSEPTVFSEVTDKDVDHVNFYSLTYAAKAVNSLPKEYLTELMKRKKGLIIITGDTGKKNIPSANCTIYELIVDETNGVEIKYRPVSTVSHVANQAYRSHTLVNIIHT